ncbi:hypothetical protein CDL15_Pgr004084 [Punica granatum]|uniref:Uncharacterized protein n=1 Tax=Punica granatum TaxID=22663 RepID=A0A218XEK8_PUNGR|nr:hypothetical protein CDL15_Pgr004084 [Punica granatum]
MQWLWRCMNGLLAASSPKNLVRTFKDNDHAYLSEVCRNHMGNYAALIEFSYGTRLDFLFISEGVSASSWEAFAFSLKGTLFADEVQVHFKKPLPASTYSSSSVADNHGYHHQRPGISCASLFKPRSSSGEGYLVIDRKKMKKRHILGNKWSEYQPMQEHPIAELESLLALSKQSL